MNELFTQQLLKDHQTALLAEAEQHRLGSLRQPKEPLVRFRLTIELQLGRRRLKTAD